MKMPLNKSGAIFAALLIASCSQGPTAPTAAPAAKIADAGDGRVSGAAAGDVKNGPIEIGLVRVAQTGGGLAFYASAGGAYTVRPNSEVEIYVQIWTSDSALAEAPRLIVDWGVGGGADERDRIHCGPCRISRTYNTAGRYTVTVTMDDRVGGVTSRTFALNVENARVGGGGTSTFSNGTLITINDDDAATPYPSTINVPGNLGKIEHATVTISGYSHTWQGDLAILLVAPNGQTVSLMNDGPSCCGPGNDADNANVTFEDGAAPFPTADFGPGNFTAAPYLTPRGGSSTVLPGPAPGGAYGATLSLLNGADPSGAWRLFVFDDQSDDIGQIAGGWSLTLTTVASSSAGAVSAGSTGAVSSSVVLWPNDHILNHPYQKQDPQQ